MRTVNVVELISVIERLVALDPFDYEQGLCYWCGGGWEDLPGPRGGKPRLTKTGKHKDDCPYAEGRRLVGADDTELVLVTT
jgi:hypothetical protein